jgi:hypothetical protein
MDMDDMMDDANDNCFEQFVSKNGDDDMDGDFACAKGTRKYDLSITYDFFHQTPRMWLLGYSGDGELLS